MNKATSRAFWLFSSHYRQPVGDLPQICRPFVTEPRAISLRTHSNIA